MIIIIMPFSNKSSFKFNNEDENLKKQIVFICSAFGFFRSCLSGKEEDPDGTS